MPVAPSKSFWTVEKLAKLKRCVDDGLSAGTAADRLGATRNATLAKANREGWHFNSDGTAGQQQARGHGPAKGTKPVRKQSYIIKGPVDRLPPTPLPIPKICDTEIPLAQRKTIFQLENQHCRWPVNEVGAHNFFYCGDPSADLRERRPYCAGHARQARP